MSLKVTLPFRVGTSEMKDHWFEIAPWSAGGKGIPMSSGCQHCNYIVGNLTMHMQVLSPSLLGL